MRLRRSEEKKPAPPTPKRSHSDKKHDERVLTAELKLKYATYIDLIPDLKDIPYFDLLLVERLKTVKPIRFQQKVEIMRRRITLPYSTSNQNSGPNSSKKRKQTCANAMLIPSKRKMTCQMFISSPECSDIDEDTNVKSPVLQEFTSTVSPDKLKLTFKIKPSADDAHTHGWERAELPRRRRRRRGAAPGEEDHTQYSKRNRIIFRKKCACCH